MKRASEALYIGTVVHRRMRPVTHKLRYSVFAVLFDCDRLEGLDRRNRLLSYNRFNLSAFMTGTMAMARSLKTT